MRIIVYLVLTLLLPIMTNAQSLLERELMHIEKQKKEGKVTLRTSPISEMGSMLPPAEAPRFKLRTEPFSSQTEVTIFLKEYINNKWEKTEDEFMDGRIYGAKEKCIAEIIPVLDTTHLKIYTMLPGTIGIKHRSITNGKTVKGIPLKTVYEKNSKATPFLLLYEDDDNNTNFNKIAPYIKNDTLSEPFNYQSKPYSSLGKYIIILYKTECK